MVKGPANFFIKIARSGVVAAMYAALTLAVPSASFGLVQFRVAEALTILPVFDPAAIAGLTVGCAVSNTVGLAMGANIAGAFDILFGSLATFSAAWLTYWLRKIRFKGLPLLSTLPPVILNAVVVGLELTLALYGFSWRKFMLAAAYVGIGQFAACTVCGLVLYAALHRSGAYRHLFGG
jgi:uncharacterized membrane protein